MLQILNLTKTYGKYKAANDVNFTIEDGEIGILLGPNGAGKSTVIKSIAGLLRYKGKILIRGMEAKSLEAKKIFAYVPELPAMYEALTVKEHIEFIINAYHVRPKVILLDEPMVGLDPAAIKELKQVVMELKEMGTTILISTHMLEMVKDLWDVMFVMDKGHIIASYKKSDVKEEDLEELFFHVTDNEKEEEK